MKKLLILLCAGGLLGALGSACNDGKDSQSPEEPKVAGTLPVVDVPDDVSAFFEKYLPESPSSEDLPEFDFGDVEESESLCLTINSADELKAVAPTAVELPHIDFEKYTLVIGRYMIPQGGCILKSQSIDAESDEMKLSLIFEDSGKGLTAEFRCNYWGLYAKLPQKPIALECTYLLL
jgi:hypothetical protein